MNTQFSVAIHILVLLAAEKEPSSSQYIASSVNSNATLVRKICRYLKDGHFIKSSQGVAGYSLNTRASEINLGAVYQYIFNAETHFAKIHQDTNPNFPIGHNITHVLDDIYQEVDQAIIDKLSNYTIANIHHRISN